MGGITKDDRERTGMFTERYRKWLDEAASTFKDPPRVRAELDQLLTRLRNEEEQRQQSEVVSPVTFNGMPLRHPDGSPVFARDLPTDAVVAFDPKTGVLVK